MTATLTTARLTLDRPQESDIDVVFALCQDPEIHRWVPLPWPYSRSDAEFFVRSYVPHGLSSGAFETWAIRTSSDGSFIGAIELRRDAQQGSASFGCWVGEGSRGRGYMKEAATSVIEYGLGSAGGGYSQLRWEGLDGNLASRTLAASLGFVIDAGDVRTLDFRGEVRRSWLGVLHRADGPRATDHDVS